MTWATFLSCLLGKVSVGVYMVFRAPSAAFRKVVLSVHVCVLEVVAASFAIDAIHVVRFAMVIVEVRVAQFAMVIVEIIRVLDVLIREVGIIVEDLIQTTFDS